MQYLFELSKEYPSLASEEIKNCFIAENLSYQICLENENVLILSTNQSIHTIAALAKRLAFTYTVSVFLMHCTPQEDSIKRQSKNLDLSKKGSIAVTYRNRSHLYSSQGILPLIAEAVTKKRTVDLQNPDIEIRVIITDDCLYVGEVLQHIDRAGFDKRKAHFRPFFSPISLHPRIARLLVNLSQVKQDQVLLDPFCGTGGILIEAGLLNVNILGSDIEEKNVNGCQKNLSYYNIKDFIIKTADVGNILDVFQTPVDVIVTDLPYGKATTTKGESKESLYHRAFHSIKEILKPNGTLIVGVSDKNMISLGRQYFHFDSCYTIPIHRSLTRYFIRYRN